jgi:hypothetical protein
MLQPIRHSPPDNFMVWRYSLVTDEYDRIIGTIILVPYLYGWLMIIISHDLNIIKDKYSVEYITSMNDVGNRVYYLNYYSDVPFTLLDYRGDTILEQTINKQIEKGN